MRIIMHVDFDSFYASLEERRKPEIKGMPVVICMYSGRSAESGAVATASYSARALGIRAGMPIAAAKIKAGGESVFLPADMEYYRAESGKIMDILEGYAGSFQQASIDEAYLDVSSCGSYGAAEKIAEEIKKAVSESFSITCSIGIGPSRLVAKMASGHKKPDGLTIVEEKGVKKFIFPLPVRKLHGVGGKTAAILESAGVKTAEDIAGCSLKKLEELLGKNRARLLKEKAEGVDDSPVAGQAAKQISRIATLKADTGRFDDIYERLSQLAAEMHRKIEKNGIKFRTVSVIIISPDLEMRTRSRTIQATGRLEDIVESSRQLLKEFVREGMVARRAGIRVSNLVSGKERGLHRFL